MRRLFLGLVLACWNTAAPAATVTLLNQTFYVEMASKSFDNPQVFENGNLRPFFEAATMTWAELGMPDWGFDLGKRFEVNVVVEADESLAPLTFNMKCSGPGAALCPSYSLMEGWFDGTNFKLFGINGGSGDTVTRINRFGGTLEYLTDAWGWHTLPDGREWSYEDGYSHTIKFQPIPLPSAGWMLVAGLCAFAALGRRRAGKGEPPPQG